MFPVAPLCIWPRFGVSSGGLIVRTLDCGGGGREWRDAAVAAHCCLCTLSQSNRRCWPSLCPLRVGHRSADTNLTFLHPSVVAMRRAQGWRLRAAESSRSGQSAGSRSLVVSTTPHHTTTSTATRKRTERTRLTGSGGGSRRVMSPIQTAQAAAATTERR